MSEQSSYRNTTRGITVTAVPHYLADQSDPAQSRFVWAYTIHIRNDGPVTVQLLNRHWHITDAAGRARDVRGPGVIGEQPILAPGEEFEYTSGVPLTTASGIMEGEYEMVLESGAKFEVLIPAFSLDSPVGSSRPN